MKIGLSIVEHGITMTYNMTYLWTNSCYMGKSNILYMITQSILFFYLSPPWSVLGSPSPPLVGQLSFKKQVDCALSLESMKLSTWLE